MLSFMSYINGTQIWYIGVHISEVIIPLPKEEESRWSVVATP
jgi:hypothetical protein